MTFYFKSKHIKYNSRSAAVLNTVTRNATIIVVKKNGYFQRRLSWLLCDLVHVTPRLQSNVIVELSMVRVLQIEQTFVTRDFLTADDAVEQLVRNSASCSMRLFRLAYIHDYVVRTISTFVQQITARQQTRAEMSVPMSNEDIFPVQYIA